VVIAGPRSANDFIYPGCTRYELENPASAAALAAELSVNVIIAHTMPFYDVARWTGAYPPVVCWDHGEPPADLFPDAELRKEQLLSKDIDLLRANKVFAISEIVATESRTPITAIIENGNSHLGQWSNDNTKRREELRQKYGWQDHFVILNICRFHKGERYYKGIDTYLSLLEACYKNNLIESKNLVFVLGGKGNEKDVAEMTRLGLRVFANISDNEIVDLYYAADAYINFSKWEGYNLGIAQALAMGLPTMASDIPAHRAFDIFTSNNMTDSARWVMERLNRNEPRKPRIWSWDEPTAKLVSVIEEL
jgi:glycosyltransferase involved in cell wall biosynthesis